MIQELQQWKVNQLLWAKAMKKKMIRDNKAINLACLHYYKTWFATGNLIHLNFTGNAGGLFFLKQVNGIH